MKMKTITKTARRRIEAQGFVGLSDETLAGINYALRLAPAICMTWAAVGTVAASPAAFWSLLPFAALGAILPGHPFDVLYNLGLRRAFGTPRLPPYPKPRRFACALASLMLAATALCFQAGATTAGYLIGGSLAVAAGVNVFTGFCIPSFLYGLLFGTPTVSCGSPEPPGPQPDPTPETDEGTRFVKLDNHTTLNSERYPKNVCQQIHFD